jgi:hypothetical protein
LGNQVPTRARAAVFSFFIDHGPLLLAGGQVNSDWKIYEEVLEILPGFIRVAISHGGAWS